MPVYALGTAVPDIHPDAYVHPDAVVIGLVTIGADATIWPTAVLRGDDGHIVVGARTSIQDGTIVHANRGVHATRIGAECVVGHNAHLEGCVVEDGSLVGSGSVVLHRAMVRSGALVGVNAVVPNDMEVPSGVMALGVPAKLRLDVVRPGSFAEAVDTYVERGRRYREDLRLL